MLGRNNSNLMLKLVNIGRYVINALTYLQPMQLSATSNCSSEERNLITHLLSFQS